VRLCSYDVQDVAKRCKIIQQILTTVVERELFSIYLKLLEDEEESLATEKMSNYNVTVEQCQGIVDSVSFLNVMKRY